MSAEPGNEPEPTPEGNDDRRIARRQLLRVAAYLAPAMLGTFSVARRADAQASCQPACCTPTNCCFPDVNCCPWFCAPIQNCQPCN